MNHVILQMSHVINHFTKMSHHVTIYKTLDLQVNKRMINTEDYLTFGQSTAVNSSTVFLERKG